MDKMGEDEKIIEHLVVSDERRYRGCRGPDKNPRKINPTSLHNLKPFRQTRDTNNPSQITTKPTQKISINSRVWIGLLVLLGIIFVYFIWKYFKEKTKQHNSDNSIDFIGGETNNGQV